MDVHKLPFLSLLERLRNEPSGGFSISLEDYRAIIVALSAGHGVDSMGSLRQTLKALLVKHRSQEPLFERSFRAAADEYYLLEIRLRPGGDAHSDEEQFQADPDELALKMPDRPDREYATLKVESRRLGITRMLAYVRRLLRALSRSISQVKAIPQHGALIESDELVGDAVEWALAAVAPGRSVTLDYQPASLRQIRQCFRLLRKEKERIPSASEIDIDATVRGIAQDGLFFQVVHAQSTLNTTRVVWFIDTSCSMRPLERYTERIVNSLDMSLRRQAFYFDNAPWGMYFADASHVGAIELHHAYACITRATMSVIISDAGALRGTRCEERIRVSKEAISEIYRRSPHVIWLNPMPRERWVGTSAEAIAEEVPMFSLSLQDVVLGVNALRAA